MCGQAFKNINLLGQCKSVLLALEMKPLNFKENLRFQNNWDNIE